MYLRSRRPFRRHVPRLSLRQPFAIPRLLLHRRSPTPSVSPGVAFVLGLILSHVGAIYNGQYAKGLIHVFILGMLITIVSGNEVGGFEPLFGVLIPAFWAYMAFEAYHTAKLRQAGKPVDEFSSLVPGGGGSRFPIAPILLIAVGVVFLLNSLEIVELRRMLRYWPVMLIALGTLHAVCAAGRQFLREQIKGRTQ